MDIGMLSRLGQQYLLHEKGCLMPWKEMRYVQREAEVQGLVEKYVNSSSGRGQGAERRQET
jgi:hypothetical protein